MDSHANEINYKIHLNHKTANDTNHSQKHTPHEEIGVHALVFVCCGQRVDVSPLWHHSGVQDESYVLLEALNRTKIFIKCHNTLA